MKQTFSIKDSIRVGWDIFKERPWFLIGAVLFIVLASSITGFAIEQFEGIIYMLANIADFVFQTLLGMGLTYIMLAVYDKRQVEYSDWFKPISLFGKYFVVILITMIAVVIGLILFIIPGVIAMLALMFAPYLVIEKSMGPIEAIKKSWNISKGHRWQLLLFMLTLIIFNILGILAIFIGLLVTAPISALAMIHVYRTLLKDNV